MLRPCHSTVRGRPTFTLAMVAVFTPLVLRSLGRPQVDLSASREEQRARGKGRESEEVSRGDDAETKAIGRLARDDDGKAQGEVAKRHVSTHDAAARVMR